MILILKQQNIPPLSSFPQCSIRFVPNIYGLERIYFLFELNILSSSNWRGMFNNWGGICGSHTSVGCSGYVEKHYGRYTYGLYYSSDSANEPTNQRTRPQNSGWAALKCRLFHKYLLSHLQYVHPLCQHGHDIRQCSSQGRRRDEVAHSPDKVARR
jgi:hypothetical protein